MGIDDELTWALQALLWNLPWFIVAVVAVVLALVRRDEGLWWKLVLAGGVCLGLAQIASAAQLLVIHNAHGRALVGVAGLPAALLNLSAVGLLLAGAFVGRRPTTGQPQPPAPAAWQPPR